MPWARGKAAAEPESSALASINTRSSRPRLFRASMEEQGARQQSERGRNQVALLALQPGRYSRGGEWRGGASAEGPGMEVKEQMAALEATKKTQRQAQNFNEDPELVRALRASVGVQRTRQQTEDGVNSTPPPAIQPKRRYGREPLPWKD